MRRSKSSARLRAGPGKLPPGAWALLVPGAAVLLAGCAGGPARGDGGELPVTLTVYFDAGASAPAPPGSREIRFSRSGEDVALQLVRALESEPGLVSRVRFLAAADRSAAIEAATRSYSEFLLGVAVGTGPGYGNHSIAPLPAALEVLLWLFGGVPAWFVPSVKYHTPVRLDAELIDVNRQAARKDRFEAGDEGLSLWERSGILECPADYLLSIVLPPMLIAPGDPQRASERLAGAATGALAGKVASALRGRIGEALGAQPLALRCVSPAPGEHVQSADLPVALEISSRDGARLRALDIHRLAPGVPPHRWVAGPDEIRAWNEGLAAGEESVRVQVAQPLPLRPGTNLIKIRALTEAAETVSRTVRVQLDEEGS